jgi:hypothetical protein
MKHQLQFVLLYCIFCLALNNKANAIAPIIHSVIPNNTTIARYEKFELIVDVTATYASPYFVQYLSPDPRLRQQFSYDWVPSNPISALKSQEAAPQQVVTL